MHLPDVAFVGPCGNTHICSSLDRAARDLGLKSSVRDTREAYAGTAFVRKFLWHFGDRRPPRLQRFSADLLERLAGNLPSVLVTLGPAPVSGAALHELRNRGVLCVNYSTDDPFNPAVMARWHLRDLPAYDIVFTTRRANVADLQRQGCSDVRYLQFAYDPHLFGTLSSGNQSPARELEVLFIGGADADRAEFFAAFLRCGPTPTLVGAYWERYSHTRALSLGTRPVASVRELTARACINICLVRRANRDGHVMRSFEIPAVGGFMLAEDTGEHREIFGPEGRCVLYFRTPLEAAQKSRWVIANPGDRHRMASAAHDLIRRGANTYGDRLKTLLGMTRE
ncbi:MAG: CgeB family protein [Terriglobales bacterium]